MDLSLREYNLNFVNDVTLRYVRVNIVEIVVREKSNRCVLTLPCTSTPSASSCETKDPPVHQHQCDNRSRTLKNLPSTGWSVKYPLPIGLLTQILYVFLMSPSVSIQFLKHDPSGQQSCTCTIVAFSLSCLWWWSHHCSGPWTPQEKAQAHSSCGSTKINAPIGSVTKC
jgi:hypothetical protein